MEPDKLNSDSFSDDSLHESSVSRETDTACGWENSNSSFDQDCSFQKEEGLPKPIKKTGLFRSIPSKYQASAKQVYSFEEQIQTSEETELSQKNEAGMNGYVDEKVGRPLQDEETEDSDDFNFEHYYQESLKKELIELTLLKKTILLSIHSFLDASGYLAAHVDEEVVEDDMTNMIQVTPEELVKMFEGLDKHKKIRLIAIHKILVYFKDDAIPLDKAVCGWTRLGMKDLSITTLEEEFEGLDNRQKARLMEIHTVLENCKMFDDNVDKSDEELNDEEVAMLIHVNQTLEKLNCHELSRLKAIYYAYLHYTNEHRRMLLYRNKVKLNDYPLENQANTWEGLGNHQKARLMEIQNILDDFQDLEDLPDNIEEQDVDEVEEKLMGLNISQKSRLLAIQLALDYFKNKKKIFEPYRCEQEGGSRFYPVKSNFYPATPGKEGEMRNGARATLAEQDEEEETWFDSFETQLVDSRPPSPNPSYQTEQDAESHSQE